MKNYLFIGAFALTAIVQTTTFASTQTDLFIGTQTFQETLKITAVGDILLHDVLLKQSQTTRGFDFTPIWENVARQLADSDITYGNLEGLTAYGVTASKKIVPDSKSCYTGYPRFNYPPVLIENLKDSGFDVVSTANNHSMDRGAIGMNRTIEKLEKEGLHYTGSRMSSNSNAPLYTITKTKGVRIAWIACTQMINWNNPDTEKQITLCYEEKSKLLSEIRSLLKNKTADAVIVTPHWGKEYDTKPSEQQRRLAREFVNAGAIAVLGSHPHVVQTSEVVRSKDGRESLIYYSLGNFISAQYKELNTKTSGILHIEFSIHPKTHALTYQDARLTPTFMGFESGALKLKIASAQSESVRELKQHEGISEMIR